MYLLFAIATASATASVVNPATVNVLMATFVILSLREATTRHLLRARSGPGGDPAPAHTPDIRTSVIGRTRTRRRDTCRTSNTSPYPVNDPDSAPPSPGSASRSRSRFRRPHPSQPPARGIQRAPSASALDWRGDR